MHRKIGPESRKVNPVSNIHWLTPFPVEGEKHILDFQIGASENLEVCTDLLDRIEARGFRPKRRLLAVTDGSKPLRKGIRKIWPDAIIQRCLIHKARNIKSYLSYRHHGEVDRKRLFHHPAAIGSAA